MSEQSCGIGPGPIGLLVILPGGFVSSCLFAYAEPTFGSVALAVAAFVALAYFVWAWWRS
jgi:hypothetical protein